MNVDESDVYPDQHDRQRKIHWEYSFGPGCIGLVLAVVGDVLKDHSEWLQLAGGGQWSLV